MILITDTDKTRRDTVAEMFYYMGVLSKAVPPEEVEREISQEYSALLFSSAKETPGAEEISAKVRGLGMATVVAITDEASDAFDLTFSPGTYAAAIAAAISEHRGMMGLFPLGRYECMGIDASADRSTPSYLGEALPLTRTEAMILRYLIRIYPRPATPGEILRYAFRGSRTPELSSVRTHISIMNKKLRGIIGRALTESNGKGGYLLSEYKVPVPI